ncbi:hypothetical protein llap_3458 [Limosa lapponica baueri]|uniref:Uncharacterized protein n=1 Tax=Limosa lapponica baueri TaxID=1758121 RepID=A0A2I0UJK7_LIMLA|nr:hypothetical protein llap_3458 [Limosa lapponica baueri]
MGNNQGNVTSHVDFANHRPHRKESCMHRTNRLDISLPMGDDCITTLLVFLSHNLKLLGEIPWARALEGRKRLAMDLFNDGEQLIHEMHPSNNIKKALIFFFILIFFHTHKNSSGLDKHLKWVEKEETLHLGHSSSGTSVLMDITYFCPLMKI